MNTVAEKTTIDQMGTVPTQARHLWMSELAPRVGRFLLHFLEMQIPMLLGMIPWHPVVRALRASPTYAEAFQRGSALSILGHGLFMTIPMVAWMVIRRHGWRHSMEMGAAMLAPGLAIIVLCSLGADTYWPWLVTLASPAGTLGMLVYMLYRRDHFTEPAGHSAHRASYEAEPSCH